MKRMLLPLLVLALLCMGLTAAAEGNNAITLEVNTGKIAVYAADDPYLAGLTDQADGEVLPVMVIPAKKGFQLRTSVQPTTVRNRRVTLTSDNPEIVKIYENTVTGRKAGETFLTIASVQDPSVTVRYRVIVTQPVSRISVTAPEKNVAVGGSITLNAAILPEDATIKQVTWSSADERIATVDANGTVTGVKRGTARITAAATDGSNIRASINLQVIQTAGEITLDKQELTVDTGRTGVLKATVLPKDTNDKNVIWTSSDESIAKVNAQGRVTGVSLGDCEITCTSRVNGAVQAKAIVHVQQPVKKISFGEEQVIYAGENGRVTWTVEPANATNQAVKLSSSNEKVLTVSEDGTVTGIQAGEAYVRAVSTDGSNQQARVKVRVLQHVTGVHMRRRTAYVDVKQTSTAGAILEPEKATNRNMTWETADASVATVAPEPKAPNKVRITGVSEGETIVTGTTEDGGFQASILVRIGDWEKSLKLADAFVKGTDVHLNVKNNSELTITSITVEVSAFDSAGKPVACNRKDNSGTYRMIYKKTLEPGESTKDKDWKTVEFKRPDEETVHHYVVKITEFVIDDDWVKLIRPKNQPTKKITVKK